MAEPEVEAAWRAEFKRTGDRQLLSASKQRDLPAEQSITRYGRPTLLSPPKTKILLASE